MTPQELSEAMQVFLMPHLETIKNEIKELKKDAREQRAWLEGKLSALSCKEHDNKMQDIEKSLIELKGQIAKNREHNDRQDKSRDKRESRIWAVLGTVIAGVVVYIITNHWK